MSTADALAKVPHFQVELLSRQVMRVVIPKGVLCMNGEVDIQIATPFGVSPHLSVPVACEKCPSVEQKTGYSIRKGSDSVTMQQSLDNKKLVIAPATGQIVIDPPTAKDFKTIEVTFEFIIGKTVNKLTNVKATKQKDDSYLVSAQAIADELTKGIGPKSVPKEIHSSRITISEGGNDVAISGSVTVLFQPKIAPKK
jgi:hypothetical protein